MKDEEIKMCEYCGKHPGVTNSRYWRPDEDYDEGGWVCEKCEQELAEEHQEWEKEMASVYGDPTKNIPKP